MSNTLNDTDRLQNVIDALEVLILESPFELNDISQAERQRVEQSMQRIFAASATRARIEVNSGAVAPSPSASKAKKPVPLADRIRELGLLLKGRPDIQPRLQAVFENAEDFSNEELDQIIRDMSKLVPSQEESKNPTRRK